MTFDLAPLRVLHSKVMMKGVESVGTVGVEQDGRGGWEGGTWEERVDPPTHCYPNLTPIFPEDGNVFTLVSTILTRIIPTTVII